MFNSFKTKAQLKPAKWYPNLYHFIIFFCLFFTKNLVEQLRERRDKLRERLKHGPHEIVQEYLKMGRCFSLYLLTSSTLSLRENLKC